MAHWRSGASAESSGAASSLCAIATRRWRSSGVECFSGFSGTADDAPGLVDFCRAASGSCVPACGSALGAETAPLVAMNRHSENQTEAAFRGRRSTAGLGSFFFVFTTLAGCANKLRQLALLLLFQQSIQCLGLGVWIALHNRTVRLERALYARHKLRIGIARFVWMLNDVSRAAKRGLIRKLRRVFVLLRHKIHPEKNRRADIYIDIGDVFKPFLGPGFL